MLHDKNTDVPVLNLTWIKFLFSMQVYDFTAKTVDVRGTGDSTVRN